MSFFCFGVFLLAKLKAPKLLKWSFTFFFIKFYMEIFINLLHIQHYKKTKEQEQVYTTVKLKLL